MPNHDEELATEFLEKRLDQYWEWPRFLAFNFAFYYVVVTIYRAWRYGVSTSFPDVAMWLFYLALGAVATYYTVVTIQFVRFPVSMFARSIQLMGRRLVFTNMKTMMKITRKTRALKRLQKGRQFIVIAILWSVAAAGAYAFDLPLSICSALLVASANFLALGLGGYLMSACLPVVLVLVPSRSESISLLVPISEAVDPLGTRFLLDLSYAESELVSQMLAMECVRTADENWQEVVHELIELVPIVILDTRVATNPLIEEAIRMLEPSRIHKAVWISTNDYELPLIQSIANADQSNSFEALRDTLFAQSTILTDELLYPGLKYMIQYRDRLPRPGIGTKRMLQSITQFINEL